MKRKTERYIAVLSIGLLLLLQVFSFRLFYYQAGTTGELYYSDLKAHIASALNGSGYSFVAWIIRLGYMLVGSEAGIVLTLSLVNVVTVVLLGSIISNKLQEPDKDSVYWAAIPLAVSAIFIAAYGIPGLFWGVYKGQLITQPWHNSTYLVMRLFAILTMVCYFHIEEQYLEHIKLGCAVLFSITLAVTTYSKPNFFIGFAPMMLLYLIIDFIKTKGKSFKQAVAFGICVIPAFAVLCFQNRLLYPTGGESGVILTLDNIKSLFLTGKIFKLLIADFAFSLYTLFFFVKTGTLQKSTRQFWVMLLVGWVEYLLFEETGSRAGHGNFGWGLPLFSLLLMVDSLINWISIQKQKLISAKVYYCGLCLYALNVCAGVVYFVYLQFGFYYYV